MAWNFLNVFGNRGLSIVTKLALARFLVPEEFGAFSLAIVFLGFLVVIAEFGIPNALIQRPRDSNTQLVFDSAFWALIAAGVIMTLISVFPLSGLLRHVFEDPSVSIAFSAASVSLLLNNACVVPLARLSRRLRFKTIVIAEIAGVSIGSAGAIGLAYLGAGIWALIFLHVMAYVGKCAMLWRTCRWKPRFRFSWPTLIGLAPFASYIVGSRLVYQVRSNIDYLFVGAILGTAPLGIYTIAFMLTEGMRQQVASVVNRVTLPVFSKIQNDLTQVRTSYLNMTRVMTLLISPFLIVVHFYAGELVSFVFTDAWSGAVVPMKILAIAGVAYAFTGPSPEVLQATGHPGTVFWISLGNMLVLGVPAFGFLTAYYELPGTAVAVVATFFCMRTMLFLALNRHLRLDARKYLCAITPAIIAGGMAIVGVHALGAGRALIGATFVFLAFAGVALWVSPSSITQRLRNIVRE